MSAQVEPSEASGDAGIDAALLDGLVRFAAADDEHTVLTALVDTVVRALGVGGAVACVHDGGTGPLRRRVVAGDVDDGVGREKFVFGNRLGRKRECEHDET